MRDRFQDRPLLVGGAGLLLAGLLVSIASQLLLPRLFASDPLFGSEYQDGLLIALAVVSWLQTALIAIGAALVAAHALLRQLVPVERKGEPGVDWYG